jgi:D-alanyl-lipoteichoic acid acyltransferase DltB (MBOAT superfamily)
MSFTSPAAYLFFSVALVLLSISSIAFLRRYLMLALSLVFSVASYSEWPRSYLFLLAIILVNFIVIKAMIAMPNSPRARSWLYSAWLIAVVAVFLVVKQYHWILDPLAGQRLSFINIFTLGLSFILFRQIALGIDVRDGAVNDVGLLDYLNYNLAFWTFFAGPIQRFEAARNEYRQFSENSAPIPSRVMLLGLIRAVFGYIKMVSIAGRLGRYTVITVFTHHPDIPHLLFFLLVFPTYLYLNFSGYVDIVVGIAAAVGFRLPENFNHPYLGRNPSDYWSRWHITLSELLRDYVLFPLQMALSRRVPTLVALIIAAMVSFLIMGIWHGNQVGFIYFGLMHGAAVGIQNVYASILKSTLSKSALRAYKSSLVVRVIAIFLCQSFVILALLPFQYSPHELHSVALKLPEIFGHSRAMRQ